MLNTKQFAQNNQFSFFDCDIKLHMKKMLVSVPELSYQFLLILFEFAIFLKF